MAANWATAAVGVALDSLAARVGIYFRIEDEYVDILIQGQDVIQAAIADIISPAVAAEDPLCCV